MTKPGPHHPTQSSFHTQANGDPLFSNLEPTKIEGQSLAWVGQLLYPRENAASCWVEGGCQSSFPRARLREEREAERDSPPPRGPGQHHCGERALLGVWTYWGGHSRGPPPHSPQNRCLTAALFRRFIPPPVLCVSLLPGRSHAPVLLCG